MQSWTERQCIAAEERSLQSLLHALYGTGGVLIACFVACVVGHGTAFFRWRFLWSEKGKNDFGWPLYGWFSGLSCLGGVAGALVYIAKVGEMSMFYELRELNLNISPTVEQLAHIDQMRASFYKWSAAQFLLVPVEFGLVVVAQLLLLHRFQRFAVSRSLLGPVWVRTNRVFLAVVIAGSVVGACGNIVSAARCLAQPCSSRPLTPSPQSNNTGFAFTCLPEDPFLFDDVSNYDSWQPFCESFILFLMVVAFAVVGWRSSRIIIAAMRTLFMAMQKLEEKGLRQELKAAPDQTTGCLAESVCAESRVAECRIDQSKIAESKIDTSRIAESKIAESRIDQSRIAESRIAGSKNDQSRDSDVAKSLSRGADQGRRLHRKLVVTFVCVFCALLLRSAFSVVYAVALVFSVAGANGSFLGCGPGHAELNDLLTWLMLTPEFRHCVILVASPLAMLLALWGMSGIREIEKMSASDVKMRWRFRQLQR
jgi:hypothetical protein